MYFTELVAFRVRKSDIKEIHKIIKQDKKDRYFNVSHFCRCAILEKIRKEVDENGNTNKH